MDFVLSTFGDVLRDFRLYSAIKNVQFGLSCSSYHLYSVLGMYNPCSGTFFTLVGELGFALAKYSKSHFYQCGSCHIWSMYQPSKS